jgi:hypothetical protein
MTPIAYFQWLTDLAFRAAAWLRLVRRDRKPGFPGWLVVISSIVVGITVWAIVKNILGDAGESGRQGAGAGIVARLLGTLAGLGAACLTGFNWLAHLTPVAVRRPPWWVCWLVGPLYLIAVGITTPVALYAAWEVVSGRIAWSRAQSDLIRRGEHLSFDEVRGPAPSPDENFAAAPGVAELLAAESSGTPFGLALSARRFRVEPPSSKPARKEESRRTPPMTLADWAAAYRAEAAEVTNGPSAVAALPAGADEATVVLAGLSRADNAGAQLRAALQRPRARFRADWSDITRPVEFLGPLKGAASWLELRVEAEVAKGDAAASFSDVDSLLRLGGTLDEECTVLTYMVGLAISRVAYNGVAAGLAAHVWNDAQVQSIQASLTRTQPLKALPQVFEGERCLSLHLMDEPTAGWPGLNAHYRAEIARIDQRLIDQARAIATNPPSAGLAAELPRFAAEIEKTPVTMYNILALMAIGPVGIAFERAARAEQLARIVVVACALERHRLATGAYPGTLAELVPQYLPSIPIDIMDGGPLRYRRIDAGGFRLWSVGVDGRDDGGVEYGPDPKQKDPLDLVWPPSR